MAPYTAEGILERERNDSAGSSSTETSIHQSPVASKNRGSLTLNNPRPSPCNYELVGVVVHSGQASAGHYYSFIKDRKRTDNAGNNRNRWLKFNDTTVEEFDMNDGTLEAECFGGTYKAKTYDSGTMLLFLPISLVKFVLNFLYLHLSITAPYQFLSKWIS